MRRLLWLLASVFVLALVAAACGDDEPAEEAGEDTPATTAAIAAAGEGSIWVLLPDSATSDRWEKDDRRFFAEGFEAAGLVEGDDFSIVNAEGDAATQISQAEQAIGDGAAVIVLTSNDSGSGATIIDLAREAGVAVVEYDRFNTEGQGGDVYVSFDNVRVGATMADVMEPVIDGLGVGTPQVVMLNGGEEDNNAFLFRDGYAATVEPRVEAGEWALVADQHVPGWDNAEALSIFDQILVGAGNDVDAVFAANDGLAGSVIAALENAGIDPTTVPVSGQDATQAGIQNVLLGKQTMSVYKPIRAEAAVGVQAALALRAGQDVTSLSGDFSIIGINADGSPTGSPTGDGVVPYIALVPIGVTADNVAGTVVADGFRTLDELCTPEVAAVATEVCSAEGDTAAIAAAGEGSIWVLLPDSATSDRWEKDDRRFFAEGFEAAGLVEGDDFSIVNAEGDAATQISQAEQAIGDGAAVIVLTSNDSGSGATIIDLAREAGVAVVEYDRFNTEGQGGDVYVSFDNVRVGATMADVMEPVIDGLGVGTPQVVMLNGGEEDNNAFLFRDGYAATVEPRVEAGEWALVADQHVPGWDNAEALSIFDQILVGAGNDVDAVFAANDGLAGSVIAALENAGIDPTTVPVSGQDATQAGIQNVLLGKQTMSVYKPIRAEAAVGVQAALALRAGQDVTSLSGDFSIIGINADGSPTGSPTGDGVVPYIALVPIGVTADNVAGTVVADGFRTLDELCTPEVAAVATAVCG